MSNGLAGMDTEAVTEAVEALRELDFRVTEVDDIDRNDSGVGFTMAVEKSTRYAGLGGEDGD